MPCVGKAILEILFDALADILHEIQDVFDFLISALMWLEKLKGANSCKHDAVLDSSVFLINR